MASISELVSTSTSLVFSLTTSFSTLFRTSNPVILTTFTSIVSQYSTLLQTATVTQPEVTIASTVAIPITITQTVSQLFTSTSQAVTSPAMSTAVITSTITSTLTEPGQTITYYPPPVLPLTSSTTAQVTLNPLVKTATLTEVEFVLEDTAGVAYTTLTTILSPYPAASGTVVLVSNGQDSGWSSWSAAEKGGLIAGVVIAGLLILGIITWCLLRRRSIWLASEWVGPPQQQMVPMQPSYWGPGPAGWGIRGG